MLNVDHLFLSVRPQPGDPPQPDKNADPMTFSQWWTEILRLRMRVRKRRQVPNDGMNTAERLMMMRQKGWDEVGQYCSANQKAVSAYLKSKQILPFGFAQQ